MPTKILITQSGCPACVTARKILHRHKVKFKEVDVNTRLGMKLDKKFNITLIPTAVEIDGGKFRRVSVKKWITSWA